MDKLYILPHTHYDAEVFLTREEYLEIGYKVIIDALNLLKTDPDYRFCLDQSAYVMAFLQAYPELEETLRDMVRQGRLEIVGGMYVMSDLNVVSGESIVRQFEFGKNYYRKALGTDVKTGWMIDTFGQCRQMPQIMKKCGFDSYFFTRVANVKHSEFYWEGIDGTKILTHWMSNHYGVFSGSPAWYRGFHDFVLDRYKKLKPFAASSIIAAPEGGDFTHPVRHDPEFVREWNLTQDRPFDLVIGTPKEFIAALGDDIKQFDVVESEFNPVFQGCYSARIRMKQQNRHMESLLYDAEAWNGLAQLYGGKDLTCQIIDAWEPVLFNQVHDVMGGVQMDKVFENVQKRYMQAENLAKLALSESIDHIVERTDTGGDGIPVVIFNSLNWERLDKAFVDFACDDDDTFQVSVVDSKGILVPVQVDILEHYPNGAIRQGRLVFLANVPSLGYEVFRIIKNGPHDSINSYNSDKSYGMRELNEAVLENEYFSIKVDLWKGCITSLVLKATGKELIDQKYPYGNMLVQDEDNGDFWEIGTPLRAAANRPIEKTHPLHINQQGTVLSISQGGTFSVREGVVVSEFRFYQKSEDYDFSTKVQIYAGMKRIEIESDLLNHAKNVRYRIAFPTSIRQGSVTQEIPYGSLDRPEGEYPALNWSDYSQPGTGLCLVNCGLPGNSVGDDKMLLSIMKCTSFVSYGDAGGFNPMNSSQGGYEIGVPHHFKYALVPHNGNWRDALAYRHGEELNHPLIVRKTSVHKGNLPEKQSFIGIDNTQVMVSSLRRINEQMILRVYEATGFIAKNVHIHLVQPIQEVIETDLLGCEMDIDGLVSVDGRVMTIDFEPYEIRTFKIEFA